MKMQAPFWSESELFSPDCEIIRGRITKKGVKISQKPPFAGGAHRRSSFLFPFSVASGRTVHSGARIFCFPFPVAPEGYRLRRGTFFPSLHTRRFARPERTKNPRKIRGFFQKSVRFSPLSGGGALPRVRGVVFCSASAEWGRQSGGIRGFRAAPVGCA